MFFNKFTTENNNREPLIDPCGESYNFFIITHDAVM